MKQVKLELLSVSSDLPKDELQTAIELSLQESHNAQEEERELNRYKRTCFFLQCLFITGDCDCFLFLIYAKNLLMPLTVPK